MQLDKEKIIKKMTLAAIRQYRSFDNESDEDLEKLYENRSTESVLIDSLRENAEAGLKALARELPILELKDSYEFREISSHIDNLEDFYKQLKEFGNE